MAVTSFPADVGIALICHNNGNKALTALASLDAAGCPRAAVVVYDVASTDGTADRVRDHFPGVDIVRLTANDGPNPARNRGIVESRFPYVLIMDGDVRMPAATVPTLRAAMAADRTVKIASPIVVRAEAPETIQYAGTELHFICEAINPWKDRARAERGVEPLDIGVASGNGLLIERQAAMDIGLFDERYFLGKDDGDFTHRTRMAGFRIVEPGDAVILHDAGPRGDRLFYYQLRNRWHFMLKNYQLATLIAIAPCLAVHELLQAAFMHAKGYGLLYWKAVGGLIAMLPALPRDRALNRRVRRLPDARLLRAETLLVRDDLLRGGFLRSAMDAYDAWLRGYWNVVRRLLPS